MVERYRRGKRKQKLLGSHQKCWIWGKNAVSETLRAGRWPLHELRLSDALSPAAIEAARDAAGRLNVPVVIEPPDDLTSRCRSAEHQGYLAKMAPFPYDTADDVLAARPAAPLYVVLDSIQDPYNFGGIVRAADVLAADAVFIAESGQVGVTSLVARTSAGAVNHVRIARVDNLVALVARLRREGVRIVAAGERASRACNDYDWSQPTAFIIGNEGAGVDEELLELSDVCVRIPQFGQVESLNAAVAAGILLYEARRQRGQKTEVRGQRSEVSEGI